ncbi:class II aldolase [Anaerocolumna aminovalerica]|uniref:Fructose-bisphosphate aldolase n=1 Tax=Anaerocolumna aminovalerica TaxID=1527 RepID=A0A1I5GPY2_9FIRM|nr:class II fructose-bisphosphate aldolase [Anaerocolumna aminovalerica]SFO37970.1 fructose-bisphosphate aldolase [Anaerocolumna aminovalerica]
MPLVNMSQLLEEAQKGNYGIGAFSVANMEMVMGAIKAAEELKSPIILQIAQVRLPYSPLSMIGPLMVAAAKTAAVPVAVHLDHGLDLEVVKQALDLGFTSVMIDASQLPIEENISIVKKVIEIAKPYGASVEAEVGQLAGSEDGSVDNEMLYSDPDEVEELYKNTNLDAIALSIGNAHGLYKQEPKLNFSILEQARKRVPVPLVLHGGTGISVTDFRNCIAGGVRKLNVATATFLSVENAVREYSKGEKKDYFLMSSAMVQGTYENVSKHIKIFQSDNKA